MSSLKILELCFKPHPLRQEFWTANFPTWSAGGSIEFRTFPGEEPLPESDVDKLKYLKGKWREWTKDIDGILLDDDMNSLMQQILPGLPRKIRELQKMDYLSKDPQKKWWPDCMLRECLHQLIVKRTPSLDCSQIAYVTGSGLNMRVAISVVVQLGFPKINLVVLDTTVGEQIQKDLQRYYFGIDIQVLGNADLTMQKNNGSLLINTTSHSESTELINDLSYLNFILADGLMVDTNIFPLKNHLIEEATNVGLPVLKGVEIAGSQDHGILKNFYPSLGISADDYVAAWSEFVVLKQP